MKYTEEQLEGMVEALQREVKDLRRLLQGQQRYDFRYDNSEKICLQRAAKSNVISGDGFTSWQEVPIVTSLTAGDFITLSPTSGVGDVIISAESAESGMTYDYLFDGVNKVTIPTKTTDFLEIDKSTSPATASWIGAMPALQDSNKVVIDVTKNRIYLHGFFAGG